jgi:hypothetical protein
MRFPIASEPDGEAFWADGTGALGTEPTVVGSGRGAGIGIAGGAGMAASTRRGAGASTAGFGLNRGPDDGSPDASRSSRPRPCSRGVLLPRG